MADPSSKSAELQRTYTLSVPLHDLEGDAPTAAGFITMELVRADGRADTPLFGPQGLVLGEGATDTIAPAPRDDSMISEGTWTFKLLPNDYYFVSTAYILTVGQRAYHFAMPARDTTLIELLDAEGPSSGGGGNTPRATVLPSVESVADASELLAAQGATGEPIFAKVTAAFGSWHVGDLLVWTGTTWALLSRTSSLSPLNLGKLYAWFQPSTTVAVSPGSAQEADILSTRPAVELSHVGTTDAQSLYVAYPEAIDGRVNAILIDGTPWDGDPLGKGPTQAISGVLARLWSAGSVDVTGGVSLDVELVLGPDT